EELIKVSLSERWRAWRESEFKYKLDRQSDMVEAHREGERIGLEKGERIGLEKGSQKSRQEIARKLKAMGLSADQIAAATGLGPGELP
ncbi:MAG: hypothetical protein LBC60_05135, partial [Spirochaetaceae bacterium]|nr:hypothetical protein [Spirochaetaceae bacterium]